MDTFDSVEGLAGKNAQAPKSKLPIILLIIIIILLLAGFILLIIILTKIKTADSNEEKKEDTTPEEVTEVRAPIIGLTGMRVPTNESETIIMTEDPYTPDQIQVHYIEAIEKAGGIPIGLPVLQKFDKDSLKKQMEIVDALIIQGGLDVDPSFYNEERDPLLGQTNKHTDQYLIEAIKIAKERKIPILGICRGMQIINVAFGGSLYQDLSRASIEVKNHRQNASELCEVKHNINIQKNTLMAKMFPDKETMGVNSWHHQAINRLAQDFIVDALADDGKIIEAIHHKADDQWIFAVQFHPEQFMRCGNNAFIKIFTEFIDQAIKKRDKK
jgi:putative glutamine amidotransferase